MWRRDSPAQERMERALQLKRDRRWAEAETLLLEVLTLEPGNLFARVLLGDIYLGQNRSQEAEKVADELLGIRPDYGAGLVLKGRILFERVHRQQGQTEWAMAAYQEILRLSPNNRFIRAQLFHRYPALDQTIDQL